MSGIRAEAATLRSEKSTDIRQTNIIAAKGKISFFDVCICVSCRTF